MIGLRCPPDRDLTLFLSGAIDLTRLDEVASHLDDCPHCLKRLAQFDDVRKLAGSTLVHSTPPDAAYAAAVDQLLSLDPNPEPGPGSKLRDYTLLEAIGQGGMGSVYKARHERLDKLVAVKVMRRGPWSHTAAQARFEREMKAVGRLANEHIVHATDAGEADGVPFLVMDLIDGVNLSRKVKESGPFKPAAAFDIIRQAAQGLAHAHAAGLVHRDVKPGNLMVTPDGRVKILDLGLAAIRDVPEEVAVCGAATVELAGDLTSPSRMLGTRDYMAPEQRFNASAVDARADVYGLGGTLWYLLTGKPPYVGPMPKAVSKKLWSKLLAAEPAERFASADAVAKAFTPRRRVVPIVAATVVLIALAAIFWPAAAKLDSLQGPRPGTIPMTPDEAKALQNEWADSLGRPPIQTDEFGATFALVPPGGVPFGPTAIATITRPYELAITEVTFGQFEAFVKATGYKTTAETDGIGGRYLDFNAPAGSRFKIGVQFNWRNPGHGCTEPNHPVGQVTWKDATRYCAWLSEKSGRSYRLPTEAEWLWAHRAGEGGDPGDAWKKLKTPGPDCPFWVRKTVGTPLGPKPVATRPANAWGLHDMFGNVLEICADEFNDYPAANQTDYCCTSSHHHNRVMHGFCYYTGMPDLASSRAPLETCHEAVGFRVLREIR